MLRLINFSERLVLETKTFKYYNNYNYYINYNKMENTTIALPKSLKDQMQEFGYKGETYSEIIARLIKSAKERQLHDLLMSEEGTISIDEARKELNKKWPRSK